MNGYDGPEGVVKTFQRNPDDGQLMAVISASGNCNQGMVSESCPFTEGSELNAYYHGDAIVRLQNYTNKMFYHWDPGSGNVLEDATGAGQLWVQVDEFANGGGLLINVDATNSKFAQTTSPKMVVMADSTGNGDDLALLYASETKNPQGGYAWINEGT